MNEYSNVVPQKVQEDQYSKGRGDALKEVESARKNQHREQMIEKEIAGRDEMIATQGAELQSRDADGMAQKKEQMIMGISQSVDETANAAVQAGQNPDEAVSSLISQMQEGGIPNEAIQAGLDAYSQGSGENNSGSTGDELVNEIASSMSSAAHSGEFNENTPNEWIGTLVKEGIDQKTAEQVVVSAMQKLEGGMQ